MNKIVILALCLYLPSVYSVSDEMKELIQSLHGTCVEESSVNEALIDKVNADKVMIDDENLKCYIKCLLAQMAAISDDGVVDVEATVALIPEDMKAEAEPIIRGCGAKTGANPCESAWLTHKCYLETKPSAYTLY